MHWNWSQWRHSGEGNGRFSAEMIKMMMKYLCKFLEFYGLSTSVVMKKKMEILRYKAYFEESLISLCKVTFIRFDACREHTELS